MERGAHHVVVVARQHRDAGAGLPVPDADGLVVGGTDDPGVLVVELDGADVVQVAQQREQAPPQLVVPDLNFVVIAPGNEQGLGAVEVHPTHRSIVLIKPVYEGAHTVIPQLRVFVAQGREVRLSCEMCCAAGGGACARVQAWCTFKGSSENTCALMLKQTQSHTPATPHCARRRGSMGAWGGRTGPLHGWTSSWGAGASAQRGPGSFCAMRN